MLETDACTKGLGAVLSQKRSGVLHPVAYASRSLSSPERNYGISELETLAVVWAMHHFHAYLYGHSMKVIIDHSAVKAILQTPSPTGKHARWWSKVFSSGVADVEIVYRPGKENVKADALSRNPLPLEGDGSECDAVQVARMNAEGPEELSQLLESGAPVSTPCDFDQKQRKDPDLRMIIHYLEDGTLPDDDKLSKKIVHMSPQFTVLSGILYFIDAKQKNRSQVAVPAHLKEQILEENHGGAMAGHFSVSRLYNTLCRHWWWDSMYRDSQEHARNCAECAIVSGTGRPQPPLRPIPVSHPFQILGVDVMELPQTSKENRYVAVFQDFLTKWPFVFPTPDQKALRIAHLLTKEVVPFFGVPDALLSDRGANLLSHILRDVCQLLSTTKLNTTAYHPQCDGMVERMNCTLKAMLRKHTAKFGKQWDQFLPGVLWAYRNTPHESTKEKPSFLLFGVDLRSPTEAALLPPRTIESVDLTDYREELTLSLSSARELAVSSIQDAQKRYKHQYDKKARVASLRLGDWVLVRFPEDEAGRQRKLSRPWHGPYRVTQLNNPDITVVKVYFPEEGPLQVHQLRVCQCPSGLPVGFYWYGGTRKSSGRVPQWVERIVEEGPHPSSHDVNTTDDVPAIPNTSSHHLRDRASINPPERLGQA